MNLKKIKILPLFMILLLLMCSCKKSVNLERFEVRNEGIALNNDIKKQISGNTSPSRTNIENAKTVYEPLNYNEQKAIWFSYIDLAEFISGKSKSEFKALMSNALKNVSNAGFNTVYIHVRAFEDAFYKSDLFPKTYYLGSNTYDPLKIIISIAHKLNLSVHAWINPFRCGTVENLNSTSDIYTVKKWYNDKEKNGTYIVKVKDDVHLWLNPAYEEVRQLVADGASEIVKNYKVDGIHFDDYFYPTTEKNFDKSAFKKSGNSDLSSWRIDNINKMVKLVYSSIKKINTNVKFGISPQGNIENDYQLQFADVKTWCSKDGYIDYITPQVYYGYSSTSPYLDTIKRWDKLKTNDNIKLIIGLAEYKVISEDEYINNDGIIARQINDAKKLSNYGGVAVYNYKNLFSADSKFTERVESEYTFITKELSE